MELQDLNLKVSFTVTLDCTNAKILLIKFAKLKVTIEKKKSE